MALATVSNMSKSDIQHTCTLLQGEGDPGYWETSRFLLEAGLCLALQVTIQFNTPCDGSYTHVWSTLAVDCS